MMERRVRHRQPKGTATDGPLLNITAPTLDPTAAQRPDILMSRAAVAVLVLDPRVREPDVPIVVRQLVFPRPPCNLFRLAIRPAIAVLLPAIAFVEESLIVALQLVVEDDSPTRPPRPAAAPQRAGRRDRPWCRASAREAF